MTDRTDAAPQLRRALRLPDLILYGIVIIQPTAPMPVYGVVSERAHGHVVTSVLIAMVAMLFTAVSYGRMARVYPSAGSAFSYVGREIHPALGYLTGWGMVMDYLLNPLICTILCAQLSANFAPAVPYTVWAVGYAGLFTAINLFGIQVAARVNLILTAGMGVVILLFFGAAARYLSGLAPAGPEFFSRPFYDPQTFELRSVLGGTSLAVLTYIGFDGISTLSEEVINPRRNILLATVLVCLITGFLAACEVYAAQLIWPTSKPFPDVTTAFVYVAGLAGGQWLLLLVNATLLVATVGSGVGSQLGAARLLYAFGRGNALPRGFFGALDPVRQIPRNNVLLSGALALAGALTIDFEQGVELLNFGALVAFMGVNAASLTHYYLRNKSRGAADFLVPACGFLVCLSLWYNLGRYAKIAGAIWMAIGLLYGMLRTRGFRDDLIDFGVPASADD